MVGSQPFGAYKMLQFKGGIRWIHALHGGWASCCREPRAKVAVIEDLFYF